ncbi:MAG: Arc family DNA-binding protein [Cytophagales bacterium]|jgi:plasmid stability protein|nr:Arc family DNA-binding protein [Cytophagales bacterium]
MANITVKGIPEKLYDQLKIRAKRNNRSLNSEIILSIQLHTHRTESNSAKILDLARKAQAMGKGFLDDQEVELAKSNGRK